MKKIYTVSTILFLLTLSGCGAIQQKQIADKNNQILANKSKIGKFPVYFANQIDELYGKNSVINFVPVEYVTNDNIAGWMTCIKQGDQFIALIFNNDKIIFKESSKETPLIRSTCNYYYNNSKHDSYSYFLEQVKEEVERLKKIETNNNIFGEPPTNPLETIKKYMENRLKDPESAKYKDLKIQKSFIINDYRVSFGWKAEVLINGKNSYGGYTGFKAEYFDFKGNKLQ